jgi:hypothetical protein
MRLTLRTLLAYLDDILEPSQAREIGEKLNESSFAASLVSRIREVMRRRRLTAPTLSGAGVGIDPNTVAEYLDNTLPPDGVADVEKICLESDVHLAEAAACHQILTLALGEPVEVSSQTRERMYALGPAGARMTIATPMTNGLSDQAVDDVLAQADEASAPPRPAMRAAGAAQKPEIPEYLRSKPSGKRVLIIAVVAVVVVGWGIFVINNNPFQNGSRTADDKQPGENRAVEVVANDVAGDSDRQPQDDAALPDQAEPDGDQVAMIGRSSENGKSEENGKTPNRDGSTKSANGIDVPVADEVDEDAAPVSKQPTALAGSKKPRDTNAAGDARKGPAPQPLDESESPPPVAAVTLPTKYISPPDAVALHFVASEERWFRLPPPPRSLVHPGDLLAVPDPFQCALEIDGGKGLVTILGRSAVQVLAVPRTGNFGLELMRGQFVARPAGVADDPAGNLRIGVGIAGELWLVDLRPGTTLGVRVDPLEPTKFEQAFDKNAYFGAFYVAPGGSVAITDPAGNVHEVKGLDWLELPLLMGADGKPAKSRRLDELPKWMGPPSLSSSDQNYARLFERKFTLTEAVELSIPEVAADPVFRVSQLATECLGLIGSYGPLIDILHRSLHEEARKSAIAGLRLWLPRNPEHKELLKAELAKKFPSDDAAIVYELLWGYDVDDAHNKDTSLKLIEWMGNQELAIRELAFYHVYRLSKKDYDYRAGYSAAKNRTPLNRWLAHVKKDGGLLPAQKPVPNPLP